MRVSTHYSIRCKDCESDFRLWERNRDEACRWLIQNAAAIVAVSELFDGAPSHVECDMRVWNADPIDVPWLKEHGTHKLCVVSEYGEES
jgi:hypothetical protein